MATKTKATTAPEPAPPAESPPAASTPSAAILTPSTPATVEVDVTVLARGGGGGRGWTEVECKAKWHDGPFSNVLDTIREEVFRKAAQHFPTKMGELIAATEHHAEYLAVSDNLKKLATRRAALVEKITEAERQSQVELRDGADGFESRRTAHLLREELSALDTWTAERETALNHIRSQVWGQVKEGLTVEAIAFAKAAKDRHNALAAEIAEFIGARLHELHETRTITQFVSIDRVLAWCQSGFVEERIAGRIPA